MTQAEPQKKGRRVPINDTPVQEIQALIDRCPVVNLRVMRRVPATGRFASILPSFETDLLSLVNGKLEEFLTAKAGGGEYTIYTRDPANMIEDILPPFVIVLPGVPHDPRHVPEARLNAIAAPAGYGGGYGGGFGPPMGPPGFPGALPANGIPVPPMAYQMPGVAVPQPFGQGGGFTLPPQEALPTYARGYPVDQQWRVYYQTLEQSGRLPPGSSMHSDQLANNYASTWQTQWSGERAENAKLREKLESNEKLIRETEARYLKEIEALKVQTEAQKHAGEMAALRSEIASLRDDRGPRNGIDWASVLAALAPLAAPVVAYFTESSKTANMMNVEMRKLEAKQHENMLMLMRPQESKTDWPALIASASALLVPLMSKMMENSSPAMQAELLEMRNNSTLMQIKMLSDIMSRFDGEEEKPAWYPIAEAILQTVRQWGAQAHMRQAMVPQPPQQRPTQPLPQGQGQQPAASQVSIGPNGPVITAQDAQVWQNFFEEDPDAAQLTQLVWQQMPLEAGFHTNEWRIILFNIHARTPVDELVPELVRYLVHCARLQLLPPLLATVFEDPSILMTMMNGLPISQIDAEYTKALSESLIAAVKKSNIEVAAAPPRPSGVSGLSQQPDDGGGDEDEADEADEGEDDGEEYEGEAAAS